MSRIFITGDTHGLQDMAKVYDFEKHYGNELTKDDYLIVTGDIGVCWIGDSEKDPGIRSRLEEEVREKLDAYSRLNPDEDLTMIKDIFNLRIEDTLKHDQIVKDTWNRFPWTTLFIDGNHENHALLDSYPIEEWHGGKIHKISDSLIHLMRGQIFDIHKKTFFTLGGAESTDKKYREENISWWAREMPSKEEYDEAFANLEKHEGKVDIIMTHCAPETTVNDLGMPRMYYRSLNELTQKLDMIAQTVKFDDWYFGHYHEDSDLGKFHMRYDWIDEIAE